MTICKCRHPKSYHWGYSTQSPCRYHEDDLELCGCRDFQPVSEGEKVSEKCKCGSPFEEHLEISVKVVGAFRRGVPQTVYLCPGIQYRPQREGRTAKK